MQRYENRVLNGILSRTFSGLIRRFESGKSPVAEHEKE